MSDSLSTFHIDRSTDGSTWTNDALPTVPAGGLYQATDTTPPDPTLFYRIRETTGNGVVVPYNIGSITTNAPGLISTGGMGCPFYIATRTDGLHLLPIFTYQLELWFWHQSTADLTRVVVPGFPKQPSGVVMTGDRILISSISDDSLQFSVREYQLSTSPSYLVLFVSQTLFGTPFVSWPPNNIQYGISVYTGAILNGTVLFAAIESETNVDPNSYLHMAWRTSAGVWRTGVYQFATVAHNPPISIATVTFHGKVYIFYTWDSSYKAGRFTLSLDGSGNFQVDDYDDNFIPKFGTVPASSPLSVSSEAPTISATVDTFNDRIVLACQNGQAVVGAVRPGINNRNYSPISAIAVAPDSTRTLIFHTPWYVNHVGAIPFMPVFPRSDGLYFALPTNSLTGDTTQDGVNFGKFDYGSSSLIVTKFDQGNFGIHIVNAKTDDGWYVLSNNDLSTKYYLYKL